MAQTASVYLDWLAEKGINIPAEKPPPEIIELLRRLEEVGVGAKDMGENTEYERALVRAALESVHA